jgi:hypothetical protein
VGTRCWHVLRPSLRAAEVAGLAGHEQPNDEAEQTKDGAEDFDDEDLDETKRDAISMDFVCGRGRLAYSVGSAASARAAPLPLMPTATPQTKLQKPTVIPPQKVA